MTDDLERLEALARAAKESLNFQNCAAISVHEDADAFAKLDHPATILSLIQRVREAEAGGAFIAVNSIRWLIGDNGRAMLSELPDAVKKEIERAHAAGRSEALEEAAKVAEDFFIDPLGPYEVQERITAAIRALGEKAHANPS